MHYVRILIRFPINFSEKNDHQSALKHLVLSVSFIALKYGSSSIEFGREAHKISTIYLKIGDLDRSLSYLRRAIKVFQEQLSSSSGELKEAKVMCEYLEEMKKYCS